jgi:hypothetical protein
LCDIHIFSPGNPMSEAYSCDWEEGGTEWEPEVR